MISVELLDRVFQYNSPLQGAKDIILSITEEAMESGMIIDCMDINDNKIYSDYDKYIEENFDNIEHIYVNLIAKDEYIIGILHTTNSYVQGALPNLQLIIDSFYTGEKDAESIDNLADLIEGISWIYSVGSEMVDKYNENRYVKFMLNMGYSGDMDRLREAFTELKNAIMNMDYILIADILNYEISDIFNVLKTTIQELEAKEEAISNETKQ